MNSTQTVESLIQEVSEELSCDEKGKMALFSYMKRFIVKLKAGIAPDIRYTYYDTIPSNFTVELPDDYMEYIMVGIILNGVLIEQSRNPLILREGPMVSQSLLEQGSTPQQLYGAYYQTGVGSNMSSDMRGLRPRGEYGSFDIQKDTNSIVISPNQFVPNLYLMYRSNCLEVGEKALIHPNAQSCAVLFAKFNYLRDRYSDGRHLKYKEDLDKEMRDLPGLLNPVSLKDCIDALDLYRGYFFVVPLFIISALNFF